MCFANKSKKSATSNENILPVIGVAWSFVCAAPYRLSCVETGKRMRDGVLLLNLLPPFRVCPSGVGSSPALHHGTSSSSSVQACLGRAGGGSGAKRSQASVNGRGPAYRTSSLSKPQGTSWQRASLAAVRAHQRTPFVSAQDGNTHFSPQTQMCSVSLKTSGMFCSHLHLTHFRGFFHALSDISESW